MAAHTVSSTVATCGSSMTFIAKWGVERERERERARAMTVPTRHAVHVVQTSIKFPPKIIMLLVLASLLANRIASSHSMHIETMLKFAKIRFIYISHLRVATTQDYAMNVHDVSSIKYKLIIILSRAAATMMSNDRNEKCMR